MARFKLGDCLILSGKVGKIVELTENASEIEAMDEYIVQFEDGATQFFVSSELEQLSLGRTA